MNAPFSQATRLGRLHTVLGGDTLVLQRFIGTDHVDDLYSFTLDALSSETDIDFDQLIGSHATVELTTMTHGPRYFDGIITQAEWTGVGDNGNTYQFILRPWFWLASKRRNQRIFHNQTVVQIITAIFNDWADVGSPHTELRLTKDYPELEYTVQYRESDLDFVCRLMERFGISYHFTHEMGNHTLVLVDNVDECDAVPGGSREFKRSEGQHHSDQEHFWEWAPKRHLTTGAIKLTDYNFKKPTAAMETARVGDADHPQGKIESYDYPGDYLTQGPGKGVAALRTLQERGQDHRHVALGDAMSLTSGMLLELTGQHSSAVKGKQYLCLSAQHTYVAEGYGTTKKTEEEAYTGKYTFLPADAPYAPQRKTALPIVQGPQTAKVVGDGEIDCDEYGRILVQFHWDLNGDYSMRCRVSQNWAGKGWGGMVIPRIGMEVVVEFLEGDPDKPLVTGCVYNGKNDVPYPLPANKTKSVFRSDTHTGSGFNELSFEDEEGKEKIYLHGEKDQDIHIENNRSKRIDRHQAESVGHNKSIEVGNNHHEVIGGNMTLLVGPNKLQSMVTKGFDKFTGALGDLGNKLGLPAALNMGEGNLIVGVAKNKAETVMVSSTEIVGAGKATTVGGGYQVAVGGVHNTSVGVASYEEIGQNKTTIVGKQYEIICGDSKITLTENGTITFVGKKILVDAEDLVRITAKDVKVN